MPNDYLPNFDGKCLHVYTSNAQSGAYFIENPYFESQAGRLFLVGRISTAYDEKVWARGRVTCIAWDRVEQYHVYDSVDEWRQALAAWRKLNPKPHAQ